MKRGWLISGVSLMVILLLVAVTGAYAQTRPDVENFIAEDGLCPGSPFSIAVDPADWIWIGFSSVDDRDLGGFSVLNRNRKVLSFDKKDGIPSNAVYQIMVDKDCFWFGTGAGLARWSSTNGKWTTFSTGNSALKDNAVIRIYRDPAGNMYLGTEKGGLYLMKADTEKIEAVDKCPFRKVSSILLDDKERLWIGSEEGVAYREGSVWVPYTSKTTSIFDRNVNDILQAPWPNKEILVATDKGIAIFGGVGWSMMDTTNSNLPSDMVTDMLIDRDNNLVASTRGGGLIIIDSKRERTRVYSRKNSDILDDVIYTMASDSAGNLWLGTARGVTHLMINPQTVVPETVQGVSEKACFWENSSSTTTVRTMHSLPMNRYGYLIWGYSAFFADDPFDTVDPMTNLSWNVYDNRWLNVTGDSRKRSMFTVSVTEGKITRHYGVDSSRQYVFPSQFPAEIQVYLKPGEFFPSNNKEMTSLAESLVKKSSRGNMVKTTQDILFSKLFLTMPYDESEYKALQGSNCKDIRRGIVRLPSDVLDDNTGSAYSKNRLAVTLLRSAGVPARLVFENGPGVWGEAYINEWGWVPFDVSRPIYTLGDKSCERCVFPQVIEKNRLNVRWVDSFEDDNRTLAWEPSVECRFKVDSETAGEMKGLDTLTKARYLVIRPVDGEVAVPAESRIPVSNGSSMLVKKEGPYFNIRFFDKDGKYITKAPITEYYKTMTVELDERAKITFIPTYMGEYLILRIFEWKVLDEPTPETKPAVLEKVDGKKEAPATIRQTITPKVITPAKAENNQEKADYTPGKTE